MYSGRQDVVRSPTGSRRGSYESGPKPALNGRPYQPRSSITEEEPKEDNEYGEAVDDREDAPRTEPKPPRPREDQYIEALRHRFPNRPKNDYAYTKPPGPLAPPASVAPPASAVPPAPPLLSTSQVTAAPGTGASGPRTGPYSSTIRPNATGGTSTPDTYEGRNLPKPVLRRVNPDEQNSYARNIAADLEAKERARVGPGATAPPSTGIPARPNPSGLNVRITEPGRPAAQTNPSGNPQLSIFETIPSQGGPVHYLGTATFSQFEHCLQQCLERERQQTGVASQIIRQEFPGSVSVLDYGDGHVSASHYYGQDPSRVHTFDDYPSRPTSSYGLDDIRYINAALSHRGISLFPYDQYYPYSSASRLSPVSHARPYRTGAVVSACQVANEDPALLFSRNGPLAVHNVWSALQHCRSNAPSRGPYDY